MPGHERIAKGARAVAGLLGAVCLAAAVPAAAQAGVTLPLSAPAGAHPLVADFVEVCSRAVIDPAAGGVEGEKRGWHSQAGGAMEAAAMVALGNVTLTRKGEGGEDLLLMISRTSFPHLVATNCLLQSFADGRPAGYETTALSRIPGILGGGGLLSIVDPVAGAWSFVDRDDEVVTILSVPLGPRGFSLSMNRAERVEPPPAAPGTP